MVYSIGSSSGKRTKEEVRIDIGLGFHPVLGLGEVGHALVCGEIGSVPKGLGCVFRNDDGWRRREFALVYVGQDYILRRRRHCDLRKSGQALWIL